MSTIKKSKGEKNRKHELKNEVLARLLNASWMVDIGWTRGRIRAHYKVDRNHRAKIKWSHRRRCNRCKRMNTVGCICP